MEYRMSYAQYLEENLFKKAGMHDTRVISPQIIAEDRTAFGYQKVGPGYKNMDSIALLLYTEIAFSAGNIVSTVEDLNRWYQALFNYEIVSEKSLKEAHTPHISINEQFKSSYGYGWGIDDFLGIENRIIGHIGAIPSSFVSNVLFHASSKTLVVLLSNNSEYLSLVNIDIQGDNLNLTLNNQPMIDALSTAMLYYAIGLINESAKITISPVSESNAGRDFRMF